MILIDTSAWVEHLRGTRSRTAIALLRLADQGEELCITEPVAMELLAGADTPGRFEAVDRLTTGLRLLGIEPGLDFRSAGQIYVDVRRSGRTVRSLLDCLVAAVALRHDVAVLHRDRGYDAIAAVTGLQTLTR